MKLVIFGLSVSSSWGNGHATLWRGLLSALTAQGHRVLFFERDTPYYANHRDLAALPRGGELVLYADWQEALPRAERELRDADAVMVTSFCPDAQAAEELLDAQPLLRVFYDLDAPVTLQRVSNGDSVDYVGPRKYALYDLVISYTGGATLGALREELDARRVVPLYGHVDPEAHRPVPKRPEYESGVSYLGTYAADRQDLLEQLFIEPARRVPARTFLIGGAMYPSGFAGPTNVRFVRHVPPPDHSAFYCSSRLTLNITRAPMAAMGYCPSARIFEAAACGVPVLSDYWEGLEYFFEPGREILLARDTEEAMRAMSLDDAALGRIAGAARRRVLAEHTSQHRAHELVRLLGSASTRRVETAGAKAEA